MSNYEVAFSAGPTAISSLFVVGLATAMAMPAIPVTPAGAIRHQGAPYVRVIDQGSSSNSASMLSIGYMGANAAAYAAITKFYGELSAVQTPLEPDFAKVLFENLWDLYAE